MTLLFTFYESVNFDTLVKSRDPSLFVIPVETGIQCFQLLNPL